jgi:anaphase-promoting complex subunit 2
LRPGAKTADIIDQYISTIHGMLLIQPSGLMLEKIAQPIRQYLRNREDTVRCIIQKIFEDDLADDENRFQPITLHTNNEEDLLNDKWEPQSVELGLEIKAKKNSSDILNTLVNIYDSKEIFVQEFKSFLATRIIAQSEFYRCEKELEYVEVLKMRFGDTAMHHCEVMMKDVADSKRVDTFIHDHNEFKNVSEPIRYCSIIHFVEPCAYTHAFTFILAKSTIHLF